MVVVFWVVSALFRGRNSLWEGRVEEVMVSECICSRGEGRRARRRPPWWGHIRLSGGFDKPY